MTSRRAAVLVFWIAASFAGRLAAAAPYPTVAFAEGAQTVSESVGTVTLHLVRSGDLSVESKASIQIGPGATANANDYSGVPTVVIFAPSEVIKDVPVTIVGDAVYEPTEAFTVYIYSTYQAQTGFPGFVTITIDNDDPAAIMGFAQPSYSAGEGAGTLTASVARSGVTNVTSTVAWAAAPSSNPTADDTDFTPSSGTITFAPGETLKTFTVPILQDGIAELTESFTLTLSNVTNGAIVNGTVTATIMDDDAPAQLAFSPSSYSVGEGGGPVTVTIVRSGNLSNPSSVAYYASTGTATSEDFLPVSGSVTFAPGETQKTFTVTIFDDLAPEGNESFSANLAALDASQLGAPATITIVDNDNPASIGFAPASYDFEENAGPATLTVRRTGGTTGTTTVNYTTANGSALAGSDFVATSGTLTFAPGETTKTFDVPLVNDNVAEPSETFPVTLTAPGAVITSGSATVRINDDDVQAVYSLDAAPAQVAENAGSVQVTFRRTGDTTFQGMVGYTTVNGTATSGSDYVGQSGIMIFNSGDTVKTTTFGIVNDSVIEGTETFSVQLSSPIAGTIGDGTHTISILDDDPTPPTPPAPPTYRFTSNFYEVSEGAGSVQVTLLREGNVSAPSTVTYITLTNCCSYGATEGVDYVAADAPLTFAAGETSKTISIAILQDNLTEASETFRVGLRLFFPETTVTIRDDEPALRLSIPDVTVDEGNAGAKQVPVTVRLTAPAQYASTAYYSVVGGSATATGDYSAPNGSVTFAAGETERTFSVTINGDTVDEGDEYFTLAFDAYSCCERPIHGNATVTIRNDDASFSVNDVSVNEGDGGTAQARFTVRLSVPLPSPASVHYSTAPGSAQSDSDFAGVSGTLTFAPGETSKEVAVPVIGDRLPEPNETFFLRLGDAVGAPVSRGLGKATIANDDEFFIEYDGIEYAGAGKHALSLDLYVPVMESATPRPLVIWIHGDHWADGSRAASPAIREADRGYVVASIDYRSSDAAVFPAQIDDVKAAVRWLRANAARYNIDPERIAVWGFGSGGHLAALLGTSGGVTSLEDPSEGNPSFSSRVQLVIDWAGPADLQQLQNDSLPCSTTNHDSAGSYEALLIGCGVQRCPDRAAAASPISYVTPDDPPFLLMHGAADCEVGPNQSQSFARVLRAGQVDVTLKLYENAGHTGPFWDTQEALATVDAFLDSHFKAPPHRRASGQ